MSSLLVAYCKVAIRSLKIIWPIYLIIAIVLALMGCIARPERPQSDVTSEEDNAMTETETTLENETLYIAEENEQIIVAGDYMRIGVGNLREEEYTDSDGDTALGLTAGLWFFIRDHPDLDEVIRVYEGKDFEIIDHRIRVLEIDGEDQYVVLGITTPEGANTSQE